MLRLYWEHSIRNERWKLLWTVVKAIWAIFLCVASMSFVFATAWFAFHNDYTRATYYCAVAILVNQRVPNFEKEQ